MRGQFEWLGLSVWWLFAGFSMLAIAVVLGLVIYAWAGPQYTAVDRAVVEGSKSYNDSGNIAIANFIATYESTENGAHKQALMNQICMQIKTMQVKAPSTVKWISEHGGCK
jgi:hypothetical protein